MHAFPSTASGRLDKDGIWKRICLTQYFIVAPSETESDRNAMLDGDPTRFDLITHQTHRGSIGTNKDKVIGLTGLHQLRALREEAIAGVYGIGASIEGGINDFTDVKVGFFQGAITERTSLVGHAAMQSVGVVIGEDRHRSDMQLP